MEIEEIMETIELVIEDLQDIQLFGDVLFLESETPVNTDLLTDALDALRDLYEQINT